MIIQIVLGLLLLASFVACYFSSKYWHWAHVLLVETLLLLGLGYFILAGEVLRIQNIYGQANQRNLQQIERLEPQVEALEFGTRDQSIISSLEGSETPVRMEQGADEDEPQRMLGLRDLDHQLGLVTRTRGRVWRDVETANLDPNSLTVTLRIPAPDPHGIENDTILYVFEQGPAGVAGERGANYIGDFRVVNVGPQQVQLQPASQFDERSVQRLQSTRAPWILYENMPVDQHPDGRLEIFAGTSPEELKKLLPAESVEEYIRHGAPARPDDDEFHRTGYDENGNLVKFDDWSNSTQFKYRRALRDYNLVFQELSKRFTSMQADHNALVEDNKQLSKALASAKQLQAMRQAEQAKLQSDLAGASRDRQSIEAHQAQVETQLANARALLEETIKRNAQLAEMMSSPTR